MYQDVALKQLRQKLRNNSTDAEKKLWSALRRSQIMGLKFTRQYSIGRFIADFYCSALRLVIELDGSQHLLEQNVIYDFERTKFLNSKNITVMRFFDNEVLNNLEGVVERIIQTVKNIPSLPPLINKGRSA